MISISSKSNSPVFSSSLNSLEITTNRSFVNVKIIATKKLSVVLYDEILWTYEGAVSIPDVKEIVESYMRRENLPFVNIIVNVSYDVTDTDTAVFKVIYCEDLIVAGTDPDVVTENIFLTTLQSRRIAPDASFSLYAFSESEPESPCSVYCNYSVKDSSSEICELSAVVNKDERECIYFVDIDSYDLRSQIAAKIKANPSDIRIISFSVALEGRYAVFFVDDSLEYGLNFFFLNVFNVIDSITIPAVSSHKLDVNRSLANLRGKHEFYDRSVEKVFEVQSGPLSFDEALFIEQLMASWKTLFAIPSAGFIEGRKQYALSEILITEANIGFSDDDQTQSVKFTWRFANDCKPLFLDLPSRIYTKEFNKVFA